MSPSPTRVDLIEDGQHKLALTHSDPGSLNNRDGYTGRADVAVIHGPVGSKATFFDDQQFKAGQNSVFIETIVEGPVHVPIGGNFVDSNGAAGNGVYRGETDEYK